MRRLELLLEVLECRCLSVLILRSTACHSAAAATPVVVHLQRAADVLDVVERLQLGDAARQHHDEQRDQRVRVAPQQQVRAVTQLLEPTSK